MYRKVSWSAKMKSAVVVTAFGTAGFAALQMYNGNGRFHREVVMPLVHLLPPETAHRLAVNMAKYGLVAQSKQLDSDCLRTKVMGLNFPNPLGLAAGFDKDGEAINGLSRAGFGFIEVGTVTPLPQAGNSKPRVFRYSEINAVVNRYGFNNAGHGQMMKNVEKSERKDDVILGVNLGKNKSTSDEDAVLEYATGASHLGSMADYLVINVSSPNTPGLTNLQHPKHLSNIIKQTSDAIGRLDPHVKRPKLLIKISPDLTASEKRGIASVIDKRVDGLIVSNTTSSRPQDSQLESGGLSGAPLKMKSTNTVRDMYSLTAGRVPIIGCGGVWNGEDAYEKIRAGASLVQVYTVLVYEGLPAVNSIKRGLEECLLRDGFKNVSEAVGADHKRVVKPCCSIKALNNSDNTPKMLDMVAGLGLVVFTTVAHSIVSGSS